VETTTGVNNDLYFQIPQNAPPETALAEFPFASITVTVRKNGTLDAISLNKVFHPVT
jgi:hypothetical protein